MNRAGRPGALLMTYGSPASLEAADVGAYLARVRGGREPSPSLVEEFTRRYRVIGGSPLIEITRKQANALSARLDWPVEIGMRFSEPSIVEGLRRLADQAVTDVAAIILSPQHSAMLMGGYQRAVDDARSALGSDAPFATVAGAWHREPAFIAALAGRIRDSLGRLDGRGPDEVAVLLTAHSLPRRVAEREPDYLDQLRETASLVADSAGLTDEQWRFCWQSAGHEPGEWMTPDFADLMPELAAEGHSTVLVAPVQFLADHLEILYDVDVGAREQAERNGLRFERIASLNDDPELVEGLAAVARQSIRGVPTAGPAGSPAAR